MIMQGMTSYRQVIEENDFNMQQMKMVQEYFRLAKPPQPVKRTVYWFYGLSGSGKTREAIDLANGDYYISMRNLKWWDGYYGQKYVIIDDFRGDFCTFHELLRILDRYPYRVEMKGTSMWIQPSTTHIIITSCYHPEKVYDTREDIQQLLRRIDEIRFFEKDEGLLRF